MMIKFVNITSALVLLAIGQPAIAGAREAAFASSGEQMAGRHGMFAGATWQFGLTRERSQPRMRSALQLSPTMETSDASTLRIGRGLEFGFSGRQHPRLTLGGVPVGELGQHLNMSGGGQAALIVGGVVVVGALAAFALSPKVPDDFLDSD